MLRLLFVLSLFLALTLPGHSRVNETYSFIDMGDVGRILIFPEFPQIATKCLIWGLTVTAGGETTELPAITTESRMDDPGARSVVSTEFPLPTARPVTVSVSNIRCTYGHPQQSYAQSFTSQQPINLVDISNFTCNGTYELVDLERNNNVIRATINHNFNYENLSRCSPAPVRVTTGNNLDYESFHLQSTTTPGDGRSENTRTIDIDPEGDDTVAPTGPITVTINSLFCFGDFDDHDTHHASCTLTEQ